MTAAGDIQIDLLLFSLCGIHFGVDAGQVAGIELYAGEQNDDLFWFHEEIGFGDRSVRYSAPTVVTIRTGSAPRYRLIIDKMEDIAAFSQNDIRLFPELLERFTLRNGLWGILPRNGSMVLLVDFKQLSKERHPDRF
ncbi:MAG: hypothetical protein PHH91_08690 [Desulfuromonadaceae bacterium]|nr:hypothetical protein [Desulfuromonadaceae bacterium]